ncbi:MAG TPA: hypothetical protein QF753_08310 [Victivallales bacterium]|nr:hypothetical protein [Victivallales bacterium]
MRRRTKKFIHYIFIIIFFIICIEVIYPKLSNWLLPNIPSTAQTKGADVYIAYSLNKNSWTEFKIQGRPDSIQVTTNAEFLLSAHNNFTYGIEYMILNSKGNVLLKKTYYQKANGIVLMKRRSRRIMSNPFLLKGDRYLATTENFVIPLTNLKKPTSIKVKIAYIKYPTTDILVRVAQKSKTSKTKQKIIWYRLSEDKRKELANANFYSTKNISRRERVNIIKNFMSYSAPIGKNSETYEPIRIGRLSMSHFRKLNFNLKDKFNEVVDQTKTEMFQLYLESAKGGIYTPSTKTSINKAIKLFEKLFKWELTEDDRKAWNALGMSIKIIDRGNREYLVVYESKGRKTGKGFYMFCKNKLTRDIALEMPHRFFDTSTGIIGYKMMLSGYFVAGAWNSVHRYQAPNDGEGSSDMAHTPDSFFYAYTKAFANSMPKKAIMLQIHGYDKLSHKEHEEKRPKAVISNSTKTPSKRFLYYANLLKAILPKPTFIYPEVEFKALAALDNIQAKVLRDESKDQVFIHLEMAKSTRDKIKNDAKFRSKLIKTLTKKTVNLFE